jgi:hypothetical protein
MAPPQLVPLIISMPRLISATSAKQVPHARAPNPDSSSPPPTSPLLQATSAMAGPSPPPGAGSSSARVKYGNSSPGTLRGKENTGHPLDAPYQEPVGSTDTFRGNAAPSPGLAAPSCEPSACKNDGGNGCSSSCSSSSTGSSSGVASQSGAGGDRAEMARSQAESAGLLSAPAKLATWERGRMDTNQLQLHSLQSILRQRLHQQLPKCDPDQVCVCACVAAGWWLQASVTLHGPTKRCTVGKSGKKETSHV